MLHSSLVSLNILKCSAVKTVVTVTFSSWSPAFKVTVLLFLLVDCGQTIVFNNGPISKLCVNKFTRYNQQWGTIGLRDTLGWS